jgi:hypothetical protein
LGIKAKAPGGCNKILKSAFKGRRTNTYEIKMRRKVKRWKGDAHLRGTGKGIHA